MAVVGSYGKLALDPNPVGPLGFRAAGWVAEWLKALPC